MKIPHLRFIKLHGKIITLSMLLLILSGILLDSCIKKEDFDFSKLAGFEWSPNIAVPLVNTTISMQKLLSATQLIQVNSDGSLMLVYKSTVFSSRADQLITIPNQNATANLNVSTGVIPVNDSAVVPNSSIFTFDSTKRYDSILVKAGSLNLNLNGTINHNARIYINIPQAKKNGAILTKTVYYNYPGSLPVISNTTIDLSGYTLSFATGNKITVNYSIVVYGDANPDNSPYTVNIAESITGILFSKIFGYLGQINFPFNQDSVMLDIFKNKISGSFLFDDPRLYIYVNNAFGLPLSLTIDTLNAVNSTTSLAVTGFPSPWSIKAPTLAQMGQSVQTVDSLTQANSNIKQAVNMPPIFFKCHATAQTNPPPNHPLTDQNFVIDTSKIGLDIKVNLPLSGSAWNFVIQDTSSLNLGENINNIEWILFKFVLTNGFPIDAHLQMYFTDSQYHKLDSLIHGSRNWMVLRSGTVGPAPDYRVMTSTVKDTSITITRSILSHLGSATKLIIRVSLATTNNGASTVKFYNNYGIGVKLGVQAQGHVMVYPNQPHH